MKKLIIMLLVTFSVVTADVWISETVDAGENPSLALDSSDNPHIAYTSSDSLKYARWDGSAWQIETVDTGVSYSELELDSTDMPCIAYLLSDNSLKYARWDGTDWQIEAVDSGATSVSFELDSTDKPSIAYMSGNTLKYACLNGSVWDIVFHDITGAYFIGSVAISFDTQNESHFLYTFVYYNGDDNRYYFGFRQLHWDGVTWSTIATKFVQRVYYNDYPTPVGGFIIDSSNNSHVVVIGPGLPYLYYFVWDGVDWNFEFHDEYMYATRTSIVLDSLEEPHLIVNGVGQLWHCYKSGLWRHSLLNILCDWTSRTSSAINSHDDLYIAFCDRDGNIRLAYKGTNTPPVAFSLLAPADGDTMNDWPLCDWEDSTDSDGHYVTYDLWYSTDDTFSTHDEITDLTESEYQFVAGELQNDSTYYWKVVATDSYDETWSTETWSFYVAEGVGIEIVELASQPTDEGVLLSWSIVGDTPASVSVLRELTQNGSVAISGELSGSATSWLDVSAEAGVEYAYYLEVTELDGTVSRFGPSEVVVPGAVNELTLNDPYPNPANDALTVSYELATDGAVSLSVYDLSGRLVQTLVSGEQTAGRHSVSWDSSTSATGVYLLRLEANGEAITKRAVISR